MPIVQTPNAKRQRGTQSAYASGVRMTQIFQMDFLTTGYTTGADKIELGVLPADTIVVGATLVGEGLGAFTAAVGIMTGEPGDPDNARTVGTQLFTAQSVNATEGRATQLACNSIASSPLHRSIGATITGTVTAGASKKLTLVLEYVAAGS